jgi:hypothetical protein
MSECNLARSLAFGREAHVHPGVTALPVEARRTHRLRSRFAPCRSWQPTFTQCGDSEVVKQLFEEYSNGRTRNDCERAFALPRGSRSPRACSQSTVSV